MFEVVAEVDEDGGDDRGGGEGYEADGVVGYWRVFGGRLACHDVWVGGRELEEVSRGGEEERREEVVAALQELALSGLVDAVVVVETSYRKRCWGLRCSLGCVLHGSTTSERRRKK